MLCVDRLGLISVEVTLEVHVKGTDIRPEEPKEVDFGGIYSHNPPFPGVIGIEDLHKRAKVGTCGPNYQIPAPWVTFGIQTLGDPRNRFLPFKLSDWKPNVSPVLSANGNGGTIPNGAYVTATEDATLDEYIDGIGLQIFKGCNYVVQNGRWEDLYAGIIPAAKRTFSWTYNSAPHIQSGGIVDGVKANFGDCYVVTEDVPIVDPPIDGIQSLIAGEIIQFIGFGWISFAQIGTILGYQTDPFWTVWCRNMWDINASLPNTGGVEDPTTGPIWLNGQPQSNLWFGAYLPTTFTGPIPDWKRRTFDYSDIYFYLLDITDGATYDGKITPNTSDEWIGSYTDPNSGVTVDATYKVKITRV